MRKSHKSKIREFDVVCLWNAFVLRDVEPSYVGVMFRACKMLYAAKSLILGAIK
jgi:hypothetical protein